MKELEFNTENNNENVIEFLTNSKYMTVTVTQRKWISKIKKLKSLYPEEVIMEENKDGSIIGRLPITYLKISHPKTISEDRKQAMSERMKQMHERSNSEK